MIPILDPNNPPEPPRDHIIDPQSGYAIDLPLCQQETPAFWDTAAGQAIREDIYELRRQYDVTVPDDGLVTVDFLSDIAIDPIERGLSGEPPQ